VNVIYAKWCEMKMNIGDYGMPNVRKKNETMNIYIYVDVIDVGKMNKIDMEVILCL
jgi:hypothetical protein